MENLTQRSIEIILDNQAASGAYIASPNFPAYRYCWFRDGSFTAYAMDLVGEHESAAHFHEWAAKTILRRASIVQRVVGRIGTNQPMSSVDILHTRYTLEGEEATPNEWPNFQMDGFGTWLWSLGEHLALTGKSLPEAWARATELVATYLTALWQRPCYDCWEEHPDKMHLYTLAAIYGGLKAHAQFATCNHQEFLRAIEAFVRQYGVTDDFFVKYIGSDIVDASLLGLATPYRLVEPDDPVMLATVARIEQSLASLGGVHRYSSDTYYGGGEWVLLAGWLGWYYIEIRKIDRAHFMLEWMESHADVNGYLPEQVPLNLNDPNYYTPWIERWGPIANPLLWSHAMYIIVQNHLSMKKNCRTT